MSQAENAARFAALHQKGAPLVLYNIWDAGGAKTLAEAGAPAIATGSWSVAAAQGYEDGEAIPLDLVLTILGRICATVDLPVSLDFEGGYATDPAALADNVARVIRAGAVGINFEDQIVGGAGLYPIADQVARLRAIRAAATGEGVPLFVNARTDLFLNADQVDHADLMAEAQARLAAYAKAGADGLFVPGLKDPSLIRRIVATSDLPVNVMKAGDGLPVADLAALGVARISFGPGAYRTAQADLRARFEAIR